MADKTPEIPEWVHTEVDGDDKVSLMLAAGGIATGAALLVYNLDWPERCGIPAAAATASYWAGKKVMERIFHGNADRWLAKQDSRQQR